MTQKQSKAEMLLEVLSRYCDVSDITLEFHDSHGPTVSILYKGEFAFYVNETLSVQMYEDMIQIIKNAKKFYKMGQAHVG